MLSDIDQFHISNHAAHCSRANAEFFR